MYKSPDRLRLPLIFYLAHTASVYINKLLLAGLIRVICTRDEYCFHDFFFVLRSESMLSLSLCLNLVWMKCLGMTL